MKIIVDGMGGDNGATAVVHGAVQASKITEHIIVLVGDEKVLAKELKRYKYDEGKIQIVHASQVITGEDPPVKAVRNKTDSSMVKGLQMVKSKEGAVFISAGNTGALMAGSLFILGRIQGIDRPALAVTYPVLGSHPSLLVDVGANAECKPNNLLEFGIMGSIYMEKVLKRQKPTVGLVNIGTEENKGTTIIKAAYELLSSSHLNFVGNIEAREIPYGAADVVVCDGFVGNVILKLSEGLALKILKVLKQKIMEGAVAKLGALILMGKFKELKASLDYSEYGAAPILGVKGPVLKMHGSSEAVAVKHAILRAVPYAEEDVVGIIEHSVLEIEEILNGE